MWIPPEADATELEAKRLELETLLNDLTAEADDGVSERSSRR